MTKKARIFTSIAAVLLVLGIVGAIVGFSIYSKMKMAYEGREIRLYFVSADGADGLHAVLVDSLGEEFGDAVYFVWDKANDDKSVYTGSLVVKPGITAKELARRIRGRQQDPVQLKFNNLRYLPQLSAKVDERLYITAQEFEACVDSTLSARGVAKECYPAYFLPDTYEFYWSASAKTVVDKMLAHYDNFWNDSRRSKATAENLTPEQVSVLASIVEEESNKADERPVIARLYMNRLNCGMKLQADPTVKFALGNDSIQRITNSHLSADSPYNTYKINGLPPGPIRIPDAATLDAVINAPRNNYLYMCAKEDFSGYHNFTSNYNEHLQNARRYQKALDAKGIR